MSYLVQKVEAYYNIELFNGNSYRPELTRDGQLLIHKIQHLLQAAKEFDEFAKQLGSKVESELRLGISSIFPMARVASLLQQLKQDFPNTIINLEIETSSGERLLLDDKVDIGIYGNLTQNNKVSYKRIDTFHLPVFVSKQFPVDADRLDKQALTQYPQAVLKPSYKSGPTVGVLHEGIQWYVSDHHTKKERIRSGL